uniref:Uncharacterized protein n=1 Tax=Triticum urartu TaxID=4572 RepID=A0A8R7U3Q7_TRIUA
MPACQRRRRPCLSGASCSLLLPSFGPTSS